MFAYSKPVFLKVRKYQICFFKNMYEFLISRLVFESNTIVKYIQ